MASYAYTALKRKIVSAGEGDNKYTAMDLDKMAYDKYAQNKITAEEYDELCFLIESLL